MRLGPMRHPWFAAFTGSVGLGGLGDEVARLALPLLILDLTHSIAAAATLRLVQSLPYVVFGGIAGVLIDRADKRKLLIACDLLSIALTLAIPLSFAAGVFTIELLYVIGFLLGTVEVACTGDKIQYLRDLEDGAARAGRVMLDAGDGCLIPLVELVSVDAR